MNRIALYNSFRVTAIAVTLLFSCKNNFKDVQKVGVLGDNPIAEAEQLDLKYTEFEEDTVRLISNLLSPKMLDYNNKAFGFREFPEGIELRIYDKQGEKTTIFSDYAILYEDTSIIDLQGNVIIATQQRDTLFTEQLYYNQKAEWLFTNDAWTFKRPYNQSNPLHGIGFDSDKEFKRRQMLQMGGDVEFNN